MIDIKRDFQPITLYIRTHDDLHHILAAFETDLREMDRRLFNRLELNNIRKGSKEEHYLYIKELFNRLRK